MPKTITVSACSDCLFLWRNMEFPETECRASGDRNIGGRGHYERGPSPDWCPLRTQPVLVQLRGGPQ